MAISPVASQAGTNSHVFEVAGIGDRLREIRLGASLSTRAVSVGSAAGCGVESQRPSIDSGTATLSPSPRRRVRNRSSSAINAVDYNVQAEAPPEDRRINEQFQQAFAGAKGVMTRLVAVLGSGFLHTEPDSTMRRLHGKAAELAGFDCPPTRTVGFVGDSGVGKFNHARIAISPDCVY